MAFGAAGGVSSVARSAVKKTQARLAADQARSDSEVYGQADAYRAALEKAAYGDAGAQYGQGLGGISNYLARSGPLADSGAATALRQRLASQVYGAASGRIGSGFADYLGKALNARQQFNYQKQLMAYQRKINKRSLGSQLLGAAGGIGGAILGGPAGAAAGYGAGSSLGGSPQGDYPTGGYYG